MKLLNRPPKTLEERYFSEIRPLLYERHGTHHQWGTREKHTLAEHLDSACQFVLTVSRMAGVPDDKRAVILAATAVHDLNKLDKSGRNVKTLARNKDFLQEQLEEAGVSSFVPGEDELELARRLIERHSGHNASDGALFLPEDPQIKRWTAILIAADLFDLDLPAHDLTKKLQKELTVALNRPSNLYRVRVSEDRGYMTALLLGACEEVLIEYKLTPLAIFPDGELLEGESLPDVDLVPKIAGCWQSKIDAVFGNNIDQLVKPGNNGIRIMPQAVQQDLQEVIRVVLYHLEKKKAGYKAEKVQSEINKHVIKVDQTALTAANDVGLLPVSNAEEFALAEGLKAAFVSYRKVKPEISVDQVWDKIAHHVGLSEQQRQALQPFDEQYGRSLLAARAVTKGLEGIQAALMESLEMRKGSAASESEEVEVSEELIDLVAKTLNLPNANSLKGFGELDAYTQANPRQRCSLGPTVSKIEDLASMPVGTKVQVFSNRLPGGLIAEPKRQAESTTLLGYQLLAIGAHFPAVKNEPPYYLHLALPEGSSPELLRIWRECLLDLARTNAEGGPVSVDALKLYRDNAVEFTTNKVVGIAFPKRPEFVHNVVPLPMVWGDANASVALLKSLRLTLELSLSFDFGFPFVLSSSLQIEPSTEFYGRVEGIPTSFSRLLGSGRYNREQAEIVRDRLRWLGNLVQAVASISKFDQINIASHFYSSFATVIFDEFHLYDAKQLVGLLFYLALSHEFGFFNNGRRAILLTATPEPACDAALSSLKNQGVKIALVDGETSTANLLLSQTTVNLDLRPQPDYDRCLLELGDEVSQRFQTRPDHYGAVILDSLDQINRLSDLLKKKGLANKIGRITGPSPLADRQRAIQCPIILATSTVDVGFNFERHPTSDRQTLDWLIFSARDRAAFWQRIGRVGRVLGRQYIDIPSDAIAYLSAKAWEEGLGSLDCAGGRKALQQQFFDIPCLDRPFLSIYWQSEAFLEIARPLLKLEEMMQELAQSELIPKLYQTLKRVLGGKRDWAYYRRRMQALQAAESITRSKEKELSGDPLKFVQGKARWELITTFLKAECPEEWEDFQAERSTFQQYEEAFKDDPEAADGLKKFCKSFSASYAPLFGFRSSLFESLSIKDPKGFVLDLSEETVIDPIHLLRYYEFAADGEATEITERAEPPYQISFRLRYRGDRLTFLATQMNKLKAFENCRIERRRDHAIAPTPLLKKLEKELIPGVIMCPITNASAYYRLRQERLTAYPITVSGNDFEKEYAFLPGLPGILTLAICGVKLKLPDDEEFLIF